MLSGHHTGRLYCTTLSNIVTTRLWRIVPLTYIEMGLEPQTKAEAANAITVLRSNFHSSTEAVSELERYIRHLEELLLEELGREEFERRLECLILRDQRKEESLFIPEDNSVSRKRGSSITESGSSSKKARSNSLASSLSIASGLGRSILENGRRVHSNSPDLCPRTSRKTSVLEQPAVDHQQTPKDKQITQCPIGPRPPPRRGGQSALLPNKQPSSNFHSRSSSALVRRSSTPTASPLAPHASPSPASARRDSVQSGTSSTQPRSVSVSSTRRTPILPGPNTQKSASKRPIIPPRLPKKPAFPSDQCSTSLIKPSASSNGAPISSGQPLSSPSKPFSLPNKPASGSSRPAPSLDQQQPLSLKRKPWRASKK